MPAAGCPIVPAGTALLPPNFTTKTSRILIPIASARCLLWAHTRNQLRTRPDRNLMCALEDVRPSVLARTDVRMRDQADGAVAYGSERELAAALVALDAAAWRELFDQNYDRVYRYAYVRLGNVADAEDVAAAVFSEAVKGIGSFRYRGIPVAAWLFRIAHHETVDALQRRKRAPGVLDETLASEHRALSSAADRQDLGEAMGMLKDEHREVLMLRFIEDRSVRDTAAILGKSEGAVKVLQLRALRSLRKRLGGTGR